MYTAEKMNFTNQSNTKLCRLTCGERTITYILYRKKVKNINVRIKPEGTIHVSAHPRVPITEIDRFLKEKQKFILKALDRYEAGQKEKSEEFCLPISSQRLQELINQTYKKFEAYRVPYPQIKFRKMTSSWGNCRPKQGIITLSKQLLTKPEAAIEYVIVHEFAHFVHANHSGEFWKVVGEILPDWKERKKLL